MNHKVLLVEDDSALILLLKFRYEESGYTIRHADNGRKAAEIISEFEPDLVVSDILMPEMDGLELLEYTRNSLNKKTPFIFISNAGQEEMVMNAFYNGANDFVRKPFVVTELLYRTKQLLS